MLVTTATYFVDLDARRFIIFSLGTTFLFGRIFYLSHRYHNKIITSLLRSGVIDFLNEIDFEINESNNGWGYGINIQGQYEGCLIAIQIFSKGLIRKDYLNLHGVRKDKLRSYWKKYIDNVEMKIYREHILLTGSLNTKIELEESLNKFVQELK